MKITRTNVEALQGALSDLTNMTSDIDDAIETWLDDDAERDDRHDAREEIEANLDRLAEACTDVLNALGAKADR